MKWYSTMAAMAALASSAFAEDLLFVTGLTGREEASGRGLGYTTKIVSVAEWQGMTTADFTSFKAIIIGDQYGSDDVSRIKFLEDTKNVWGPAVQGNIIVHGADQSNHAAIQLIENSIRFAASGQTPQGAQQTGLYLSLSQYYDTIVSSDVPALSYFGQFEVRGKLDCYNKVHIVASSPAINTLQDADLSNWGCSVHEAFSVYPSVGINGFQAIAIADGVVAPGTQNYGDGHSGLPYIITRGATPAGCGDGKWDATVGEECDDGNVMDGDGCSKSCKCESGLPTGNGACFPSNSTLPGNYTGPAPSGYLPSGYTPAGPSPTPSGYFGNSSSVPVPTPYVTPPFPVVYPTPVTIYATPAVTSVVCVGVEVIVSVTLTEIYSTIAPSTVVTYTTTSIVETYQKPIYNTQVPSMPCYVCALSSQALPEPTSFFTATTTHCPACPTAAPATIYPCQSCPGTTLTATCPWQTVPPFSAQGAVPYTTYSPHTTHEPCTTCTNDAATAVKPMATSPGAYKQFTTVAGNTLKYAPTSSFAMYTGGAAAALPTGAAAAGLGAVAGVGVLLGLVL